MTKLPPRLPQINFMKFYKPCLFISGVLMLLSLLSPLLGKANIGIEFAGGSLIEFKSNSVNVAVLRAEVERELGSVVLQELGGNKGGSHQRGSQNGNDGGSDFIVRTKLQHGKDASETTSALKQIIVSHAQKNGNGTIDFRKIDAVGPTVGRELIVKSAIGLLASLVVVMLYIWARFGLKFAFPAVFALFHDALLTFGFVNLFGFEFDTTTVAALLTIVGYSINDTVVIYDRIRYNLSKLKSLSMKDIINKSINEMLARSLLTACTVVLSLLPLVFFMKGTSLISFSYAMLFGVIAGTYSTVYIASPMVIIMGIAKSSAKSEHSKKKAVK